MMVLEYRLYCKNIVYTIYIKETTSPMEADPVAFLASPCADALAKQYQIYNKQKHIQKQLKSWVSLKNTNVLSKLTRDKKSNYSCT